jgi:hypothetical protein
MTTIDDWELTLDIDQVLRGQGADPRIVPSLKAPRF